MSRGARAASAATTDEACLKARRRREERARRSQPPDRSPQPPPLPGRPPRRRAAGAGVVAALVAAGCSWMPLDRLIFFPDPDLPDRPPGVEERAITTADGLRLDAWWAGAPDAAATLVWSHGNGGNIGGRAPAALPPPARRVPLPRPDHP